MLPARFQDVSQLSHSLMSDVYHAIDRERGQEVVVKRLDSGEAIDNTATIARFKREMNLLQRLDHPYIVGFLDAISDDETLYLILEYVPGGTLADLLAAKGALPLRRALELTVDLADALFAVHEEEIVHADLKPGNILLTEDGHPKISDFGIAQWETDVTPPIQRETLGTYEYMSPEACNGDKLDTRADIWSLGVVLYEMLAGRRPFQHEEVSHLTLAIMTEPPPDLQQLRPEVSDRLADLVYRMLAKDRNRRIPEMNLVGRELEAILRGTDEGGVPRSFASRFADTILDKSGPQHNLPRSLPPLYGRESERAELRRLLNNPAYRLVSLHGPGGIGKTRLAIRAARDYFEQHQESVYMVDLTAIDSPDLLVTAVADAIQFRFFGADSPETQLLNYLAEKQMLLLLDNFEHVTAQSEFLSQVLLHTLDVRLLVTTQERLDLRGEWLLPVRGLPAPEGEDPAQLLQAPAVQLFVGAARRIRPGYQPDGAALSAIKSICRLVEGVPLGLELAAAWINVFSPAEIAGRVRQSFDFLRNQQPDIAVRHRSARSMFEYAWDLLEPLQQQTLCRLSVFRGGFSRQAAQTVTGASLPVLNRLTDKALLQRDPSSGRYAMQAMIRQFSAEKLRLGPEPEQEALHRQHGRYYARFLQRRMGELHGSRQQTAVREIDREMGNVRAAWRWAVGHADRETLQRSVKPLYAFYYLRGRQREGVEAFGGAAAAVRVIVSPPDSLLAQLLARQGACARVSGQLETARQCLQESLKMARTLEQPREVAFALYQLGASDPADPEAKGYWEESLALAESLDDPILIADALNWLAFSRFQEGEADEALAMLERCLQIHRDLGDQHGLANALANLGVINIHLGDTERAQTFLQEGLAIYRQLEDIRGMAVASNNLSHALLNQEAYPAAQEWGEQALAYFRQVGDRKAEGEALGNLGLVAFHQEKYEEAQALVRECIALYRELGLPVGSYHNDLGRIALAQGDVGAARQEFRQALEGEPPPAQALHALLGLAAVLAEDENLTPALALSLFVKTHPAGEQMVRERAESQVTAWQEQVTTTQMGEAQALSREGSLAAWIAWATGPDAV